jgi:hypothetical protein
MSVGAQSKPTPTPIERKGNRPWMIALLIILIVLGGLVLFALLAGGTGLAVLNSQANQIADPNLFVRVQNQHVLRPADMEYGYHVDEGAEIRFGNAYYVGDLGELQAKTFIAETGRVDGWKISLRRNSSSDFTPAIFDNYVEVYETSEGASAAISPAWFWAYTDPKQAPDDFIDESCNIGQECLLYSYTKFDPATGLTTERYDVVFRFHNIITWVSAHSLDVEVSEQDALNAAQFLYDKLQRLELVSPN